MWWYRNDEPCIKGNNEYEYELPGWAYNNLIGENCGPTGRLETLVDDASSSSSRSLCEPGINTWNYDFIFPTTSYTAEPMAEQGSDATTSEGVRVYSWFSVNADMLAVATAVAESVVLANATDSSSSSNALEYQPMVRTGGNGVSGPTFLDHADYRDYVGRTFGASAVDMETAAVAHVATPFGVTQFIFFSITQRLGRWRR